MNAVTPIVQVSQAMQRMQSTQAHDSRIYIGDLQVVTNDELLQQYQEQNDRTDATVTQYMLQQTLRRILQERAVTYESILGLIDSIDNVHDKFDWLLWLIELELTRGHTANAEACAQLASALSITRSPRVESNNARVRRVFLSHYATQGDRDGFMKELANSEPSKRRTVIQQAKYTFVETVAKKSGLSTALSLTKQRAFGTSFDKTAVRGAVHEQPYEVAEHILHQHNDALSHSDIAELMGDIFTYDVTQSGFDRERYETFYARYVEPLDSDARLEADRLRDILLAYKSACWSNDLEILAAAKKQIVSPRLKKELTIVEGLVKKGEVYRPKE